MADLAAAIGRAAQRVPGPVAQRSLAAVAAWRPAGWKAVVQVPELQPSTRPLRIAPGEMWCARCAEIVHGEHCIRCGCNRFYPATAVLRPGEYVVAS